MRKTSAQSSVLILAFRVEIKELKSILKEEELTVAEASYVNDTIEKFKRLENKGLIEKSMIVGESSFVKSIRFVLTDQNPLTSELSYRRDLCGVGLRVAERRPVPANYAG
jgi:hypothetical protein